MIRFVILILAALLSTTAIAAHQITIFHIPPTHIVCCGKSIHVDILPGHRRGHRGYHFITCYGGTGRCIANVDLLP